MDSIQENRTAPNIKNFKSKIHDAFTTFRKKPFGIFSASFVVLFGAPYAFLEVFDFLDLDPILYIQKNKGLIYLLLITICALISTILQIRSNHALEIQKLKDDILETQKGESIVEIIRQSSKLGHHNDVIHLGSALRQSTCLKNKNTLKIQIGHLVLEAARQCEDIENEAIAQIEDIGNTHLENGNVDKAIEHISAGIELISEKINGLEDGIEADLAYFIAIRGYRNLANCYSLKANETSARQNLNKAKILTANIKENALLLQIQGDLEYAESKISRITANWTHAVEHLNNSIQYYDELCQNFSSPANERKRRESTTKNYRELGDLHFKLNKITAARKALKQGFDNATKNLDYENLVSISLLKATIAKETEPDGEGASLAMQDAEQYIRFVDSPKILKKYEDTKKALN